MDEVRIIWISLCLIVCILIPIMSILKLRRNSTFNIKFFLFGIASYLVIRVLLYPMMFLIIKEGNLLLKIVVDILYLCLVSIFLKIFIYKKYLYDDKCVIGKLVSVGFGEALSEITLVLLPTILNQLLIAITVKFGNVYDYFGEVYTTDYIKLAISNLENINFSYYVWISVVAISLICLALLVSVKIRDFKIKEGLYILFFYTNYLLVPSFSYLISILVFCILNIYAIKIYNNYVVLRRKNESTMRSLNC